MIDNPATSLEIRRDNNTLPQTGIEITEAAIKNHWLTHAQTGLSINLDEIEIVPQDYHAAVRFHPDLDAFAQYHVETNEIQVGRKSVGFSEGILAAFLRHERSHAVFANLLENDQREIVRLFRLHHGDDLQLFYQALREKSAYSANIFDSNARRALLDYYHKLRRGYWFVEEMLLWNDQSIDSVDILPIINELIAYNATIASGAEYLISAKGWEKRFDLASAIFERLHPDLRAKLNQSGFFNIEGKPLLERLKQDQQFKEAVIASQIQIS